MSEKPLNAQAGKPRTATAAPTDSATATSRSTTGEADCIELLIKYKKLLDDGVISQDEFEQKKSQFLNKNLAKWRDFL